MGKRVFTDEMVAFVRENIKGTCYRDMAAMVNARFGTDITDNQMKTLMNNRHLTTGRNTRFQNGNIPFNKGQKGFCPEGSEKGWFKKGGIPTNHRPVGSERVDADGYREVKIAEPNVWAYKHRLVYEEHYGEIPEGSVIVFLDQDKTNCNIENLKLISRNELARMNKNHRFSDNPQITDSGLTLTKLDMEIKNKMKSIKESD